MDKIFFIGRFAPPYGGATIKSEVLYNALSKKIYVDKFDTELKNKNKIMFYIRLLKFIFKNKKQKGVICVASMSLFKLSEYINLISSNMLSNITVFAIGGAIDELIVDNKVDRKLLNKYKVIYVECNGTKEKLDRLGLNNVQVIPNCRIKPNEREYHQNNNCSMRCLFLSRIDEKKGIFNIIEAFKELSEKEFLIDFYGPIDEKIKTKFNKEIKEKNNINYRGIVESDKVDIYSIIIKYDILLFPTCYGEGYPGIITESKIAGIPIISSNFKYSKEIIENYVDGIIMEENTSEEMIGILNNLKDDKQLLDTLRKGSYSSGEKCFIETYIDKIINDIKK